MRLEDLLKGGMDAMSDEELMERIHRRRRNLSVEKPAAATRQKRETAQKGGRDLGALARKMAGLPAEELQKLIAELEGANSGKAGA